MNIKINKFKNEDFNVIEKLLITLGLVLVGAIVTFIILYTVAMFAASIFGIIFLIKGILEFKFWTLIFLLLMLVLTGEVTVQMIVDTIRDPKGLFYPKMFKTIKYLWTNRLEELNE